MESLCFGQTRDIFLEGEKSLVWREGKGGEEKNFASTNFKVRQKLYCLIKTQEEGKPKQKTFLESNPQEHIHVYKPMEGGVNAGVFASIHHRLHSPKNPPPPCPIRHCKNQIAVKNLRVVAQ